MTWQQIAGLIITGAGIIGSHSWLVRYWLRTKGSWAKTETGWWLWSQPAAWAALWDLAFLNRVFPEFWGHDVIILLTYAGLVGIGSFWPHRLLSVANRRNGESNEA